jgi:hypothetical protein
MSRGNELDDENVLITVREVNGTASVAEIAVIPIDSRASGVHTLLLGLDYEFDLSGLG